MGDAGTPYVSGAYPESRICGAKRRNGEPCQGKPMGNGRCRIHGGLSLKGMASPSWKHGKFSRYAPQPVAELAYDAINDPTLYDLTELVALYQARIQNALRAMDEGGAGAEAWQAAAQAWQRFNQARQHKNAAAMFAAADDLDRLFTAAEHDIWLWKDIDVAAKNLKLLMESERKRRIEANTLIPVVKAQNIILQIVLAVRDEITDQSALNRVQARVTEIIGTYPQVYDHEA